MISFAIAYFIIGILNPFGVVSNKVVLLCSVVSLVVAFSQILDSIAIYMELMERKVLKTSLNILVQIQNQNTIDDSNIMKNKIIKFQNDKRKIHNRYRKRINCIVKYSNRFLTSAIIIFIVGMAVDQEIDCTVISDTASLISFSLIFAGIAVNDYCKKEITRFSSDIQKKLNSIGVSDK